MAACALTGVMICSLHALILASQTAAKNLSRARRCDLICAGVYTSAAVVFLISLGKRSPVKGLLFGFAQPHLS
ncbi:hypothetical protein A6A26_05880 [Pantoea sp. OXWO6B1]|nr:hypothetical protein A6A26_05880 [Pantoea sp. OXWO6B1]